MSSTPVSNPVADCIREMTSDDPACRPSLSAIMSVFHRAAFPEEYEKVRA